MFPYFIFYAISLSSIYLKKETRDRNLRKICGAFAVLCLVALATFRDTSIGTDYEFYVVSTYKMALNYPSFSQFIYANGNNVEIGFNLIAWFTSHVLGDVRFIVFFFSILTTSFIYLGIQNYKKNCSETFAWFINCFLFFPVTLNLMRQSLVVSVCFYLLTKERVKIREIIISTLLLLTIHNSAVMILALYIIQKTISVERDRKRLWYKKAAFVCTLPGGGDLSAFHPVYRISVLYGCMRPLLFLVRQVLSQLPPLLH